MGGREYRVEDKHRCGGGERQDTEESIDNTNCSGYSVATLHTWLSSARVAEKDVIQMGLNIIKRSGSTTRINQMIKSFNFRE